jgi:hypothetical protein
MSIWPPCGGTWLPVRRIGHGSGRMCKRPGRGSPSVIQECLVTLPERRNRIPTASVTGSSLRPGVAGTVVIAANFNTADGNYQGPTTEVGSGTFTATSGQVDAHLIVLPSGVPIMGVGAVADFEDGVPSVN